MKAKFAIVSLCVALIGCSGDPNALLSEASGAVSQTLCSKVFVSGLSPEVVFREHLRPEPGMGLIAGAIRYDVDHEAREVRTRIGGRFATRAVFAEGRGCTLVFGDDAAPAPLSAPPRVAALQADIAGPDVVAPENEALAAALDRAFADGETRAVVVVRHGRVIAERYAEGYGVEMPLLSHSMAKSVVNALVGLLVRDGRLDVNAVAPVAWRDEARRGRVTIDNLLRMNAGMGFDEGGGASIATHMWYTQSDTAAFAATARFGAEPGAEWGYSSRSYTLLSKIIGDELGGPEGVRDYAERELFGPLGMAHVTLEFDGAGTMMGAQGLFATPRDFARFGLLYLHDGLAGERRILPEGWVAYSTRPTGESGYGAGFWLNTTRTRIPEWGMRWGIPGAPQDAFMARGYLGQYTVIVPSADLVVVRMGASHGGGAGIASVGALVRDAIAASN
jgi:CubicO group peptidase (beta-lactamase class C family)